MSADGVVAPLRSSMVIAGHVQQFPLFSGGWRVARPWTHGVCSWWSHAITTTRDWLTRAPRFHSLHKEAKYDAGAFLREASAQ